MTDPPPSSSILYGRGSHRRRLKLENVMVLDMSGPSVWFGGDVAGLRHLNNLREEDADPERRAKILRAFGQAGGGVVMKGDLGRAAFGADYGPVHGEPALDLLVRSLVKLFRKRFGVEPIHFKSGRAWEWIAGEGIELREGTISEGRVIDVAR